MSYLRLILSLNLIFISSFCAGSQDQQQNFGDLSVLSSYQNQKYNQHCTQFKQALNEGEFEEAVIKITNWANQVKKEDKDLNTYFKSLIRADKKQDNLTIRLIKRWMQHDTQLSANLGYMLYKAGDFKKAAPYLKIAAYDYYPQAQTLYADICYRDLDDKKHPFKEAAKWHLLAALGDDLDSHQYIQMLVPNIFKLTNPDDQMNVMARQWSLEDTIEELKSLPPSKINQYLVRQGQKIDIMRAQKIPYLFDKTLHAILYDLKQTTELSTQLNNSSFVDDDTELDFDEKTLSNPQITMNQTTCSQEATTMYQPVDLINKPFVKGQEPWVYGPVYSNYYEKLKDAGYGKGGTKQYLEKTNEKLNISYIYEVLLDAMHESVQNCNAQSLRDWSHQEYPWLLAGIDFWQLKHPDQSFDIAGYSIEAIKSKLERMESDPKFDQAVIPQLLIILENETHWPKFTSKYETSFGSPSDKKAIEKRYSNNILRFFASPLSRSNVIVKDIQNKFYDKLSRCKSYNLALNIPRDLSILQTPFLMFLCEELTLTRISQDKHVKELDKAQRYFAHLKKFQISCDQISLQLKQKVEVVVKRIEKYISPPDKILDN